MTFAAHWANALVLKTEGPVQDRSLQIAGFLWRAVLALLGVVTIESWQVRSELLSGMIYKPLAWLGLIGVIGGIWAVFTGLQCKRELRAVIGSSAFIAGLMIAVVASVFPIRLHSTLAPDYSLSACHNAAAGHGLAVTLVWWPSRWCLRSVIFCSFTGITRAK